ncbi:origin recognition complex subunit 3 [Caerostris extrusa]|uniref:Origin recognition complex subunit 3 n=1 Tax=Caerostris extrusa TaxID=172846 RepID=A0AAV4TIT5_CAEEX|nr:origin recognition complex subunit 3 [Caerostris extrusa]
MNIVLLLIRVVFVHKPKKIKSKKSTITHLSQKKDEQSLWNEIETKIKKTQEVPASVLVMGVNMPDHSHIFNLLEKHLHSNNICSTVILESKKCSSVSNMMQVILFEIHKKYQEVKSPSKKKNRNMDHKMQQISKTIVFLVQDVESFNPDILQKLIFLCYQ